MDLTTSSLNGNFGIKINDVTPSDLTDPAFQSCAYDLWLDHGGLLAVRGTALADPSIVEDVQQVENPAPIRPLSS